MFDSVIIGAGVAGCVAARDLAESGRKVLVLEQRDHIGGNCYDEKDEHGILIHKYGTGTFSIQRSRRRMTISLVLRTGMHLDMRLWQMSMAS